jgi:hypothetical protein
MDLNYLYFSPLVLFVIRVLVKLLKCGLYSANVHFKALSHEIRIVFYVRHKHGMNFRIFSKYIGKN